MSEISDVMRVERARVFRRRRNVLAVGIIVAVLALALTIVFSNINSGRSTTAHIATVAPTATELPTPVSTTPDQKTPLPPSPSETVPTTPKPDQTTEPTVAEFNKSALSIDDPTSIWVVSNKLRPLKPLSFVPPDLVSVNVPHTNKPQLRREAADAMEVMTASAKSEAGLELASNSAYRSYTTQQSVYASSGNNDADTARPGYSEHQTGLAIDIGAVSGRCSLDECFANTAEGRWVAANAYRFGFILRYPSDKTAVTGYVFEPWHYRYVGVSLSREMHDKSVTTLEEFFGLPPAPNYAGG